MIDPEEHIAGWIDGTLTDAEQATLYGWLRSDNEHLRQFTDAVMFGQQIKASVIADAEHIAAASFHPPTAVAPRAILLTGKSGIAIAGVLVAMLALFFWPRRQADQTFATLSQTRSALWESGDLSTAKGSRLGQGTLRLVEGLATVQFDSGAEVIIESPAILTLLDSMNCSLTRGTVVSDIPESALGFRIKTPSANVVDYGTRFAVSVHETTGNTHTQVIEGRVQVEYAHANKMVELSTGQRNTVVGETLGEITDDAKHEQQTVPIKSVDHGAGWVLLDAVKDAYTGYVKGHESEILLQVKRGIEGGHVNRVSYLGFDLKDIVLERIQEVELLLFFSPTGWGLASHVPDAEFGVYGLAGEVLEWDESILHGSFPGNPEFVHLGSFTIPQGVQKGRFRIRTDALARFLREHPTSEVTFRVVRETIEVNPGGLVHGFASRRHPVLPAPTLAVRQTVVD